jgi:predicted transcriptional regulator
MPREKPGLTIRFTSEEHAALKKIAEERQMPMSLLIRQAVRQLTGLDQRRRTR